jgi:hypothetical protein
MSVSKNTASPVEGTEDAIRQVAAGLRAGASSERENGEIRKAEKVYQEYRLWTRLLEVLDQQFGIPANVVERGATKSRWTIAGFYEGPIRICGVKFNVVAEPLSDEARKSLSFERSYRARLSRTTLFGSRLLDAEEVARIIERHGK